MRERKGVCRIVEQFSLWGCTSFEDKVNKAIERFKSYEEIALSLHPDGYYLAFSGGKDSQCIYHIAKEAGVAFTAHNSHTTVDPPELVQFLRSHYPDVVVNMPKTTMWELVVKRRMPPTRMARYCCQVLKESGGEGRLCVTGVRWAESSARKNNRGHAEIIGTTKASKMLFSDDDDGRKMMENCIKKGKRILNPIVDWSDDDVWHYIKSRGIEYCSLYDEGFERLGCIGCPMVGQKSREREFERWPKYKAAYIRAFDRLAKYRNENGMNDGKRVVFSSGQEIFDWWMEYTKAPEEPFDGQIGIDEEY